MKLIRFAALAIIGVGPVLLADQPSPPHQPSSQEPVPTFRAGVRAIQVDAVVTDMDGNPVRGLTEQDFEIIEKGQPQPITTFEAVDIPIETQLPDLADADVVTNEGDGRIYLIVIDNISAVNGQYAKRELRKFFANHFGPSDTAAVMFLDRAHFTAGQDFTSNRRLLIKGIDSAVGYGEGEAEGVTPGSASPLATLPPRPPRPGVSTAGYEAAVVGARNRMARLKDLTEFLIRIPGRRKALILVSEAIGFDATDFQDYAGTTMSLAGQSAHAAMTAATRGNIAIYPISVSGPASSGLDAAMELRSLAAATGGFAHVNSNNFEDSFTRLVQEQSVYYMLGFNSAQEKDDGRYVPVKVTLKRPGLKVLAKEGYVAPFKDKDTVTSPERRPGVGAALSSPIPVGGVALRAFAAPFKGKGKAASILVSLEMDPHGLGLAELPDGTKRGSVDVRLVPTDIRAKVLPQVRQVGNISIPANAREDVEREGLHVLTRTELQPGRYQLRIAVGTAQRGGSVVYDLDVPDYSKKALTMSGVVLRGPNDPEGVFLPVGDPLEALKVRAPTTARLFRSGDRVSAYAEIYESTAGKPHSIDVRAVLRNAEGQVTPVISVSQSAADLKNTGGTLRFEAPLPVNDLPAGRYALSVEVTSSAGGDAVTRTVPFSVR